MLSVDPSPAFGAYFFFFGLELNSRLSLDVGIPSCAANFCSSTSSPTSSLSLTTKPFIHPLPYTSRQRFVSSRSIHCDTQGFALPGEPIVMLLPFRFKSDCTGAADTPCFTLMRLTLDVIPTLESSRVLNQTSRVREPITKMVQSAVLGFPRMGVLRDLKKATEACE